MSLKIDDIIIPGLKGLEDDSAKDHRLWPNAYFAEGGLFTMREAYILARQSRWGNHRLESRVRENRTHGSEGGEGATLPDPYQH